MPSIGIVDGLDELIGDIFVVALLHGLYHIGGLLAFTLYEQVVGHTHTFPAFVAVHCVVTSYDAGYSACTLGTMVLQLFYESFAAAGVGVTAVHKAMQEHVAQAIALGDVAKSKNVFERRMHTAVACKTHEVHAFAIGFGIFECFLDHGIVKNRAVGNGFVDFHQILI